MSLKKRYNIWKCKLFHKKIIINFPSLGLHKGCTLCDLWIKIRDKEH